MDYIPKDRLSMDRLGGTFKAALETWGRKQAEEGLKRKNNDKAGTGLGLTVCRKVVEAHGRKTNFKGKIITAGEKLWL